MENKEELEIDVEDIGTILKSNRLKQKKTLEEVSGELCIRKIYLTALEDGDYETLPPIPYGIGYVRTYANYLGLSAERAVKLYKAASLTEEQNKQEEIELEPEVNKSSNRHIIVGVAVLLFVYGAYSVLHSSNSKKNVETKTEVMQQDIQEDDVAIENIEDDTLVDNNENVEVVSDQEVANEEQEDSKEQEALIDENKVVVEFLGETWFELKDKNKVYFQGIYHQGDKKEMDYVDNLFLSAGRPKNVKVYVKGEEKNILVKRRKTNIAIDSL